MAKLMVDGKAADKQFPLRTTPDIYDTIVWDSNNQQVSVNVVINNILLKWAKKHPKYSKSIKK